MAGVEDPENRMLWRRQPFRLDAEPLQDAILHASGLLNLSRGDALGALKKMINTSANCQGPLMHLIVPSICRSCAAVFMNCSPPLIFPMHRRTWNPDRAH